MPLMNEEEAAKAVYFEAENYIPLPIESVYLDAQIVGATSNHPDHADVLIAALPKKTVDSYLYSLRKAGLKPLVFEIFKFVDNPIGRFKHFLIVTKAM